MAIKSRLIFTLMLSTIFVLSIHAQYYVQKLLGDELRKGTVFSVQKNNSINEFYLDIGVFYNEIFGEKTLFYKSSYKGENLKLKDFKFINQWSSSLGESIRFDGLNYFYLTRDNNPSNMHPDSVGWNFGKIDQLGIQLFDIKIPYRPISGLEYLAYGLELVKNNEVILWGIGIPPDRDPSKNDPYINWVRLKRDGTFVSGPHYYKPPSVTTWAQPTDATLDIDSMMVMVYDSKNGGKEKYVLKIREDDSIETIVRMPLGSAENNENAKLCVTKDGHFMVIDYEFPDIEKRILTRIDRNGNVVWKSSFDLPTGIVYGFNRTNVKNIFTNRIAEAANGDILMCGSNAVIDSFYIPKSDKKVLTSTSGSSFIARFDKLGKLLWRHFLVDQHDDGKLNKIILNDITETEDGSILVGGELGVKNDINRSTPFYMKLGPNGCFDEGCSHVDKWWYFPEDIVSVSDPEIIQNKLTLFPNPGKDQVSILLPNFERNDLEIKYAVSDTKGQTHIQGILDIGNPTVLTHFLPSGIYVISIQDSNGTVWHGKWIKE